MDLIDKRKLSFPMKLVHVFIGPVEYTEHCHYLEIKTGNINLNGTFSSLYVEHEGEIKEVSLANLRVV